MKKIENKFTVTGYVGKDAEIRNFENSSVARFSLAVRRSEKDSENHVSAFMALEAWRKNENLESFDRLKKGNLITVEGYFKPEEWNDSESGKKKSRVALVATKFYLTPEKEEEAPKKTTGKNNSSSLFLNFLPAHESVENYIFQLDFPFIILFIPSFIYLVYPHWSNVLSWLKQSLFYSLFRFIPQFHPGGQTKHTASSFFSDVMILS